MNRLADRLAAGLAIIGGLGLCFLVALTFYDVLLRYFFSAPMRGRQDIVEMGMVLILMLSAPYTWRVTGHISVDLYEAIPIPPIEIARRLLVRSIAASVFALIAWRSIEAAEDALLFNEATNMILIPHLYFIWLILGISALHAAMILFELWCDLRGSAADKTANEGAE